MQHTDNRIPDGYPTIFIDFMRLQVLNGWALLDDGSIPVDTLIAYIENKFERVMASEIKLSTLHYYLSALKSIHDANGILWKAREDRRVLFILNRLLRTPGLPGQEGRQDHPVTLMELNAFCISLNINVIHDVVAGALATSLFHGLGRSPELLHASKHPPMKHSALKRRPSPLGDDISYSFTLSYPKVATLKTQYISPLRSYGITSANFWIERLKNISKYENLWQIDDDGSVPASSWLFEKISPFIVARNGEKMGPCSFRAGGTTHLAAKGYDLRHIQLLGRWESMKAFNRYLRDHPFILQCAFKERTKGKQG
jgi:hypothetical protein